MKVGIITFHASHNYGSMLQAYALQQTVMKLGHECEIINFRTERQKKAYMPYYIIEGYRSKAKAMVYPTMAFNDWRKYRRFEGFLKKRLVLSKKEYSTYEELSDSDLGYDAYISGSDQIWNTYCFDFDQAYFLGFVNEGRRIAYAPSMGPDPELQVTEEFDRIIKESIGRYDAISVREERTRRRLEKAGVRESMSIALDPTLFLDRADWERLVSDKPLIKGDYIFLYTPWYIESVYGEALLLAKEKGLKIVVSKSDDFRKWSKESCFEFHTTVGPLEFLNLIRHAKIVIAESFHAVVFSLVFNKPFIVSNGDADSRVSNLLSLSGLDGKCVRANGSLSFNPVDTVDFPERIRHEVNKSISFLKNALS